MSQLATAMAFPDDKRGMGALSRILDNGMSKTERNLISIARYVLRHNLIAEGKQFPQRCQTAKSEKARLTQPRRLALCWPFVLSYYYRVNAHGLLHTTPWGKRNAPHQNFPPPLGIADGIC